MCAPICLSRLYRLWGVPAETSRGFPQGSRVRAAEGTRAQDKPGWFIWSEHFPDPLIHSALLQWQSPIGKRADVAKHASR